MDHKVGKQRVKTICLDLSVETNESWLNNGACRESACGCTTASRARFRRLSRKVHGPPPLRSDRWPDGVPFLTGINLVRARLANRLYSFMATHM